MAQLKVLTVDFKVAFGRIKAEIIADVTKKLSSVFPVHGADGQHSVAIVKAESMSRSEGFAIFRPHSGNYDTTGIASEVHRGFSFN